MKAVERGARPNSEYIPAVGDVVKTQVRVIVALILRDLKTRFFGSEFGFLISIAWPLFHILALLGISVGLGRMAPYGDNAALWFATGIVPFMAFSYMARFIGLGIVLNKPLLVFPRVKITDILFARAIVEILSAGVVIAILMGIFATFGIDFVPNNPVQAFLALGTCMLLGLGVGVVNAIVAAALPIWITGFALVIIFLWLTSGVFFVAHALPEPLRYAISLNPITHGIEWMRSAYYIGYGSNFIDKRYVLAHAVGWLCGGLLLERSVRGRLLR
jgi:capsular polysaccharide transport system permease protein